MEGRFGQYLVTGELVTPDTLSKARALQRQHPYLRIGEILVGLGALSFSTLVEALKAYRSQCKLGQLLVYEGAITEAQLEMALALQAETGLLLGKVLIDMEACTLDQVMRALAIQRGEFPDALDVA